MKRYHVGVNYWDVLGAIVLLIIGLALLPISITSGLAAGYFFSVPSLVGGLIWAIIDTIWIYRKIIAKKGEIGDGVVVDIKSRITRYSDVYKIVVKYKNNNGIEYLSLIPVSFEDVKMYKVGYKIAVYINKNYCTLVR